MTDFKEQVAEIRTLRYVTTLAPPVSPMGRKLKRLGE
jgi:hypothetical protein